MMFSRTSFLFFTYTASLITASVHFLISVHHSFICISVHADLKDEAHLVCFLSELTRAIALDLQRNREGGYLTSFCRKGEGIDTLLPKADHPDSTRVFARALMQNCLLDKVSVLLRIACSLFNPDAYLQASI